MDITLHDVCYGYGHHRVLDGISFSLETPEIFCILGANGAGKSTLLACMAGQQAVQSGQIAYDGQDVTAYFGSRPGPENRLYPTVPHADVSLFRPGYRHDGAGCFPGTVLVAGTG